MSFVSVAFLVLTALFFTVWPLVRSQANARWGWIVLVSLVFYGWWDWRYLPLMIGTALVDYAAGLAMVRWPSRRTSFLVLSLTVNLGVLGCFKYLAFLLDILWCLVGFTGPAAQPPVLPAIFLVLPVGISFYTFQSMSYAIDVWRGQLKPVGNPLHYLAFVTLFPQLVAGPIVRASSLLPQLAEAPLVDGYGRWRGGVLVLSGFFKKMVVADQLAPVVDRAFCSSSTSGIYWWIAAGLFAVQIYADFSGYSDIARGLCRWMGYEVGSNFRQPYLAISFRDFWRRWHVSLSNWFRDYVYIPLGGSRSRAVWACVLATMLLSALWHGAAWHFLVWGLLHGLALVAERALGFGGGAGIQAWTRRCYAMLVLLIVVLSWVPFRAQDEEQMLQVFKAMVSMPYAVEVPVIGLPAVAAVGMQIAWWLFLATGGLRWLAGCRIKSRQAFQYAAMGVLGMAIIFLRGPGGQFIYFQF